MLVVQFSQRAVIIVGGLLTASGMILSSLDLSLPWLYLTMGILQGNPLRTFSKLRRIAVVLTHMFSLTNAKLNLPSIETCVGHSVMVL